MVVLIKAKIIRLIKSKILINKFGHYIYEGNNRKIFGLSKDLSRNLKKEV